MENDERTPFVCLEVDENTEVFSLQNKLNELFPGRIVRLIINKEYSPFFYLGNGRWSYKQKTVRGDFSAQISLEEDALDYIGEEVRETLSFLEVNVESLKVINNLALFHTNIPGVFFANDKHIVIDQYLLAEPRILSIFLTVTLNCKIILDAFNGENNGIMILVTTENIFGT